MRKKGTRLEREQPVKDNLPRRDIVDSCTMLQRCSSKASHHPSKTKLGCVVLWRARLIDVASKTALKDQIRVWAWLPSFDGGFELFTKVEQG
jgi:hypothetical protein